MYVETSAIVAILIGEADGPELLSRIEAASAPTTSIVTKVEAALAIGRAMGDIETKRRDRRCISGSDGDTRGFR